MTAVHYLNNNTEDSLTDRTKLLYNIMIEWSGINTKITYSTCYVEVAYGRNSCIKIAPIWHLFMESNITTKNVGYIILLNNTPIAFIDGNHWWEDTLKDFLKKNLTLFSSWIPLWAKKRIYYWDKQGREGLQALIRVTQSGWTSCSQLKKQNFGLQDKLIALHMVRNLSVTPHGHIIVLGNITSSEGYFAPEASVPLENAATIVLTEDLD